MAHRRPLYRSTGIPPDLAQEIQDRLKGGSSGGGSSAASSRGVSARTADPAFTGVQASIGSDRAAQAVQTRAAVSRAPRPSVPRPRISLSGPLTAGQRTFGTTLARLTGLSPRVIGAWMLSEQSGPYAASREQEENHNWLNIGFFDSGPGAITQEQVWRDPREAARATAAFLQGTYGGASEGIQSILGVAGRKDAEQIRAIASSGWATNPDYENLIRGTYSQVSAQGSPGPRGPRPRAVRRHVQPTEPPAEIAAELGVPQRRAGISISRLNPDLKRSLVQLGRLSGEPVRVNEGFRTRFRQTELAAGRGGATGPAAPPGTSPHEFGEAVDADLTSRQRELLPRVGLGTPVEGEPWHLELAGAAGTSATPLAGGTPTAAGGSAVEALFGGTGAAPTAGVRSRRAPRPRRPVLSPLAAQLAARAPQPRNPLLEDEEEEEPTDLEELLSGQRFRPLRTIR